ncbi:Two-component system response regulator [Croceitalea dokdonensis DOKDO 023]|uniref:Two-component system response regulator n=1 Tax=Croceitalea dokdonensis DOKDO 023 TaxID=1300341 RepID=A0A0P7AVE1_9FLAO|nr:LytTR family DNA-binding domain-containing protein [Croceitalea dokdonensis]KPM31851.1 Two-component system response regulator [Croceitalea dokdonensis DOKDO 023]
MRKDRLYLYTFLAISLLFIIIGGISAKYFVKLSAEQMLSVQLESIKRNTNEFASLVGFQFSNGINTTDIQQHLQATIKNSNNQNSFMSVLDWSGKRIVHPDITLVGTLVANDDSSGFSMNSEVGLGNFYEIVSNSTPTQSHLIALGAVPNSDWIIAGHANTGGIKKQLIDIKNRFYTLFGLMGFAIVLGSVISFRIIGSKYEKKLELKNETLETEIINLAKLNKDIGSYQKRVVADKNEEKAITPEESLNQKDSGKKRLLTYLRNELLSVPLDQIAYIYTENTITYVVDMQGKKSTTNSSLDEIYSDLDNSFFFRANRQFIVSIISLEKIIRYGNNQLKLLVKPKSEVDIIIGKNKAAEFKKWLNL